MSDIPQASMSHNAPNSDIAEPCIIRPDRPHVCVRPDHAGLHGTPRQETT